MKTFIAKLSFDNQKTHISFFVNANDFIEAVNIVYDIAKKSNMSEFYGNITECCNSITPNETGPSVYISNQFLFSK